MDNAYTQFSTKKTPQTEPIPGEAQILNAAGGYVYDVGTFKQLERFLILGSEGGSYYTSEQKLTKENALNVIKAIESDGRRAVDLIVAVSQGGRAVKNDPAIFALALACASSSPDTRAYALSKVSNVCRIPTHLFHFLTYVKQFRGFGRGLKRAIGDWYNLMPLEKLAFEVVKYQSRDGWSNADLLRLSHPKTIDPYRNAVYRWIVDGMVETKKRFSSDIIPGVIKGFEEAKAYPEAFGNTVNLIELYNLSREMVPTESLTKPEIWEALLEKMPLTAMIRNLGNLSKCGLLKPLSNASKLVYDRLHDQEALKKARIHPISLLIASKTYSSGRGLRGSGQWEVASRVVDALNDAFYLSFNHLEPSGKRLLLAVDVSGSMNAAIANIPNMTAAEGAAAMALACCKVEKEYEIIAFSTHLNSRLKLTNRMSLKDLSNEIAKAGGGGTDCSVPITWATEQRVVADAIIILTDNETWAGSAGHPSQVMRTYRDKVNPGCKVVNVGMTATRSTINDPRDEKALDVVGFDANVPAAIAEFVKL